MTTLHFIDGTVIRVTEYRVDSGNIVVEGQDIQQITDGSFNSIISQSANLAHKNRTLFTIPKHMIQKIEDSP